MYERTNSVQEAVATIKRQYADLEGGETLNVSVTDGVSVDVEKPEQLEDFPNTTVTMQVAVHEKFVESFTFEASGGYFTRLSQLGEEPRRMENALQEAFDVPQFDFCSADSGSMSGGFQDGLADRVFTYEQLIDESQITGE